jgi:hypothetical protein
MAAAAEGLAQMGIKIGILTKTKITNDWYSKSLLGYKVFVSKAVSPHQRGVSLVWREDHDGFEVKAVRPMTPNLLTFQLVTGDERFYVMGIYIPPQQGGPVIKKLCRRKNGGKGENAVWPLLSKILGFWIFF